MTLIDKLQKTLTTRSVKSARGAVTKKASKKEKTLQDKARDHLWMHFTRQGPLVKGGEVPVIVKGEGHYIFDDKGKRYIDGLAGLFVVNAGHGRKRLAEVAAKQAEQLAFFPLWSYAHPSAIELADKLASYAPGDLNKVFFTTGGGEAVESAFKLAKQYWKLRGKPMKHKVVSRYIAYHGTPQGALAITGIPMMKEMFDSHYYGVLGRIEGRAYATIIAAGSDGEGAQRQIDRIATGWRLKRVADSMIVNFAAQTPEAIAAPKIVPDKVLKQCRELGSALGEGMRLGIF